MAGDKISAGFFNEVISEPDDIQMPDLSNADPGISYDTGGSMYTAEELQQMIADKKQQIQDLKLNVKPVSYTHLDVYKRQMHCRSILFAPRRARRLTLRRSRPRILLFPMKN